MELQHFSHDHPLILNNQAKDGDSGINCNGCLRPASGNTYECRQCDYVLHKSCVELPKQIIHFFHPQHPLTLLSKIIQYIGNPRCDHCGERIWGFIYHCSICQYDLDMKCVLIGQIVNHEGHQHSFTLLRPTSFTCDVCEETRIHAVESRLTDTTTRLTQLEEATVKVKERAEEYYKGETSELIRRLSKSYEEQMTQRLEDVESRVKDMTTRLEQQLAEAEAARLKADERAEKAQKNSSEQIQKLKEVNDRAQAAQKSSNEQIQKLKEANERAQEAQKNSSEQIQNLVKDVATRLKQQLSEAIAARLKVDERAEEAQKNSSEQNLKLKEAVERAEKAQKNSSEQIQKLVMDVTTRLEQQLAEAEAARLKADERAEEAQKISREQILKLKEADERAQDAQKNSSEQIQKLKEAVERAEKDRSWTRMYDTILEVGSTAAHVYDPSTY